MTLLIKSTHLWSNLGQSHDQTLVKTLCLWTSFRTFAAFSSFHLNTSKSANIKVVRLVEGHNFIISGIGDLEWKMLKNTVNASLHLLTELRKTETLSQISD
jgi:hypothetical protein